jgi:Uma2 family endonuclease
MTLPTIVAPVGIELAAGDELILRFRSWQDYEDLLARRGEKSGLRIRYDGVTQEVRIMSPLPSHRKNVDLLADLVKALLRREGKDWEAFTPITLKRLNQQGVEPDYCFYVQGRSQILGKERIDLEVDPPPDLVIEVDLTSMTKAEDYRAIGARELWVYRRDQLLIYEFDGRGYQERSVSGQFPGYDVKALMVRFVERGWQVGSSVAVREFEEFLREDG